MIGQLTAASADVARDVRASGAHAAPSDDGSSWLRPALLGAAVLGTAAVAGALLLRGQGGRIAGEAAQAAQLAEHGVAVTSKPILLDVGRTVRTGAVQAPETIAGWQVVEMSRDGRIALGGMVRGEPHQRIIEVGADTLLRENPGLLLGQVVRHPSPPAASAASGWLVDSVDRAAGSVALSRQAQHSSAAVDDVVRANIDELRARIQLVPDS